MTETRDWRRMWEESAQLLKRRTGDDVKTWNRRIKREGLPDDKSLRAWLDQQGVTGYPQDLLVMERFGYPGFMTSSADELIDAQYQDRPHLRPIYDAIIKAAAGMGEVAIQARKGYVSLVTPRRTFARVQATTKKRVDLGLRLDGQKPEGRLQPSKFDETMRLQIPLSTPSDVDPEVVAWLRRAYTENC